MAGVEDEEVVPEEAVSWLPSHVLDHEALWDSKVYVSIDVSLLINLPVEKHSNESQVPSTSSFIYLSVFLVLVLKFSEPCFILGICEAPNASPPSISQSS